MLHTRKGLHRCKNNQPTMNTTISFTPEELELVYEGLRNLQDSSDSYSFYNEETDTEETNEERFFSIYNSVMDKL